MTADTGILEDKCTSQKIKRMIDALQQSSLYSPNSRSSEEHQRILDSLHHIKDSVDALCDALETQQRKIETLHLNLHPKTHFGFLYSKNKEIQKLFLMAEKYKNNPAPLLILGEKGCGKESLARLIHVRSHREGPFMIYDASRALKPQLEVPNSTLYFSSVSLITMEKQKKILESLLSPSFINCRIIVSALALSHLEPELAQRLKPMALSILPLRHRKEDILPLADFFIREFSKNEKNISHFSTSTLNKLIDYPWPGNISEFKLELKRIFMDYPDKKFYTLEILPEKIVGSTLKELYSIIHQSENLTKAIETLERKMVLESLIKHNWNKSKVSRELGISRSGLIQKIRTYNVSSAYLSKLSLTKRRMTSRKARLMSIN